MQKKSSRFSLPLILIVLIVITLLIGCGKIENINDSNTVSVADEITKSNSAVSEIVQDIGQGNTIFEFEVTDSKKIIKKWTVHTAEKTVGAALLAVGLINGDTSEHGLYVKEVNGIRADYDIDKAYWAFYINQDYADRGVDTTSIESEKIYSFVYQKE